MPEYEFPSGRELQSVVAGDGTWALHLGLTAIVIASIAAIVWRSRRPAAGWDIPVWMVVLIAEWNLARWIFRNLVSGDSVFPFYFLLLFLLGVLAITITAWRCIKIPKIRYGIVFLVVAGVAVIFLLPAIQQSREAARRTQCKNNMKQIGLAMQNFVDVHHQYPFARKTIIETEHVCSWRVSIIPYLDSIPFHEVYHLEEPWNSPFNLRAMDLRLGAYHCPTHDGPSRFTDYSVLTGPGTVGADGITAVTPTDVTDGTSNTIFFVEACGREIIWTEPKDVEVTDATLGVNLPGDKPGHSRGIISSYHTGGAHVVMGDGTVRFVSEKIDKSVLKALTTINGGETVPEF